MTMNSDCAGGSDVSGHSRNRPTILFRILRKGFEAILARYSKVKDPGMLDGSVQYAHDFVEKVPLAKRQAIQVTLDQIAEKRPEAKQAQPEQFYDNSLVQELIDEGFFKSLWGSDFQAHASKDR